MKSGICKIFIKEFEHINDGMLFPLLSCLREKTYPKILLLLYIFLIYIFVVFTYFLFIYLLMLFFSLPGESTTAVKLQPETVQGCEV